MITSEQIAEFESLKDIGWKTLSKDQRKRYSELKRLALTPEEVPEQTSLQAETQTTPELSIVQKLHSVFAEIREPDDRGKISAMLASPEISSLPESAVFQKALWSVVDGYSRSVVRKYLGQ